MGQLAETKGGGVWGSLLMEEIPKHMPGHLVAFLRVSGEDCTKELYFICCILHLAVAQPAMQPGCVMS